MVALPVNGTKEYLSFILQWSMLDSLSFIIADQFMAPERTNDTNAGNRSAIHITKYAPNTTEAHPGEVLSHVRQLPPKRILSRSHNAVQGHVDFTWPFISLLHPRRGPITTTWFCAVNDGCRARFLLTKNLLVYHRRVWDWVAAKTQTLNYHSTTVVHMSTGTQSKSSMRKVKDHTNIGKKWKAVTREPTITPPTIHDISKPCIDIYQKLRNVFF